MKTGFDSVGVEINHREKQSVIKKETDIEHEQKDHKQHSAHLGKLLNDCLHIQKKAQDQIHHNDGEIEHQKLAGKTEMLVFHPFDFPFEQRIITPENIKECCFFICAQKQRDE